MTKLEVQPGSARSVLLRHTLPDGSAHLDWMIERRDGTFGLITFRLQLGIDLSAPGRFRAERIGDHRRDYLEYEGPVSGGRGSVVRVATFGVALLDENEEGLRVVLLSVSGARVEWVGKRENGACWEFVDVVC